MRCNSSSRSFPATSATLARGPSCDLLMTVDDQPQLDRVGVSVQQQRLLGSHPMPVAAVGAPASDYGTWAGPDNPARVLREPDCHQRAVADLGDLVVQDV